MPFDVAPDVDASTLRVAQLRTILQAHGVVMPGHVRKAALVAAFEEHVRPHLVKAERMHAVPETAPVTPATPATHPSAASSALSTQPKKESTPPSMGIGTPGMRSVSQEQPGASLKASPPASMDIRFSDENPFQRPAVTPMPSRKKAQRLSTPVAKPMTPTSSAKAKSTPVSKAMSHMPHTASPYTRTPDKVRQIAMAASHELHVPGQAIEMSDSDSADQSAVGPTHGFTHLPKEDQLLSITQQIRIHWRATLVRWTAWFSVLAWIWFCWQSRLEGYCLSGTQPPVPERPTNVWQALQVVVTPVCTPCPEHGVCVGGQLVACDSSDYTIEEPALAQIPLLAQLVPLGWRARRCVPDTYKLVLASELADALVDYLAHFHGQVRCGRQQAHENAPVEAPLGMYALPETEVKTLLQARTVDTVDAHTYDVLWRMVIDGLLEHAHADMQAIVQNKDARSIRHGSVVDRWLVSPRKTMPVTCRLRLYVLDWAWRHRLALLCTLLAFVGTFTLSRRVQRSRIRQHVVSTHTQRVFEQLQKQVLAHMAAMEAGSNRVVPRGIPVPHLRDTILQAEPNPQVRRQLWQHVAKVVERNANVRTRQAQWHGEWQRVWEWMGVVPVERAEIRGGQQLDESRLANSEQHHNDTTTNDINSTDSADGTNHEHADHDVHTASVPHGRNARAWAAQCITF